MWLLRQIHPGFRALQAVVQPWLISPHRTLYHGFQNEEEYLAHKESIQKHNKAGFDYNYLLNLQKPQLVYKVIRLQRQVDSYTIMKSVTNINGCDKVRVDHPDPEDVIDHRDFNLRRVAFKIAYLGWDYMAYAWSDNADRTIKGHTNTTERVVLEALLRQQLVQGIGKRVNFDRGGRTDRGVSGLSQVICANVRSNLDEGFGVWKRKSRAESEASNAEFQETSHEETAEPQVPEEIAHTENKEAMERKATDEQEYQVDDRTHDHEEIPYVKLLNEALPPDIRVLAWSPVDRRFSPRRACINRTYRYFFPRGGLDVDLMNEAAQKLIGTHNFQNFAKTSTDNMTASRERTITGFKIEVSNSRTDPAIPEFDVCMATVTGRGFLYRQVRLMMAVLCKIAQGTEDISIIDDLLNINIIKSRPSYTAMASTPLLFYDCQYDENDIDWRWDNNALRTTATIMAELWCENSMKSEITRAIYEHAAKKLDTETRNDTKSAVFTNLLPFDGLNVGKKINEMERSSGTEKFIEKARERTVRRLQRKGRYQDAANVHAGNTDTWIGWKS